MFDEARLTYIENLPLQLLEIPTVVLRLSWSELDAMIEAFECYADGYAPSNEAQGIIEGIRKRLDELIEGDFPNGCFAKLGSRSPKDSWEVFSNGTCCRNGNDVLRRFFDSERISDDLYVARANNYLPYIVLRKWLDIDDWREFRCFVQNGELVGISQYYYRSFFPQIRDNKDTIEEAIKKKIWGIKDLLPTDTIIVDVFYNDDGTVTVIECNPFGDLTDPCLFDWGKDSFSEFEFRYNQEPNAKESDDDLDSLFA